MPTNKSFCKLCDKQEGRFSKICLIPRTATDWLHIFVFVSILALITLYIITNEPLKQTLKLKKDDDTKYVFIWQRPAYIHKQPFRRCPYKCVAVEDKAQYKDCDAVMFNSPDILKWKPPVKPQGQIWIFQGLEPPKNYKSSFKEWRNLFNWTFTYRRDSDNLITYGIIRPHKVNVHQTEVYKAWAKKTNQIAWFVSRCKTQSKREQFVEKLNSFHKVSIFGHCGTRKCPTKKNRYCMRMLENQYKFYLSFESNLCLDYVTEKLFNIFRQTDTVIPVVRGKANYRYYAPPSSYISTKNFSSISELSEHLLNISQHFPSMMHFFHSRKQYVTMEDSTDYWCQLCKKLHNASKYKHLYDDISSWEFGNEQYSICDQPQDIH